MKIRWTRPTESGLGDRLYDLLFLGAYARLHGGKLYSKWEKFTAKDIDVPHRKTDIIFSNVAAHINFPSDLVFDNDETKCDATFDHFIGAAGHYYELRAKYLPDCSAVDFGEALTCVARGFSFCDSINDHLKTLPTRFISFHIRRGDKVRADSGDGTLISYDELAELDNLTFLAIDRYARYFDHFFVCGDEDEKTKPFKSRILDLGKKLVTCPAMEKWRSTYYDLATMTKSEKNVTSQRKSTFSQFPALIGHQNYRTVYDLRQDGVI